MNESQRRLVDLAERLRQATLQSRIKWSAVDATAFQYSTRESSVTVRSQDRDGVPPFVLEIYDSGGVVVESLTSEWFTGFGGASQPADWNDPLDALYEAARRKALNVDRVIDSLIRSLGEEPPF